MSFIQNENVFKKKHHWKYKIKICNFSYHGSHLKTVLQPVSKGEVKVIGARDTSEPFEFLGN